MLRNFSFCAIVSLIGIALAKDLPADFPRCHLEDPNLNSCLLKATEQVRPRMKDGIEDLGWPALSPFFLPKVSIEQGTDSVNFKIDITNATILGLDKYRFTEFNYDPKTFKWNGHVVFDEIMVEGECDFNGKILVAPLKGTGKLIAKTGRCDGDYVTTGKLVKRKGVDHYHVDNLDLKLVVTGGKLRFENFVGSNGELATAINQVINDNADELIKEIISPLEQVSEGIVKGLFEGLTARVPYSKLFPPSQ